ncbi:hypothetical protein LTR17_010631 [Elasticomyces elasticus]|nr:hypothetical protein LTR17_010631 [Elasticomyces elasticus]
MAQQMLLLPELIENIILHLPMKDLLLSQRVCKTWKAVIDSSPQIQEALFFTARQQKQVPALHGLETDAYIGHACTCRTCTATQVPKRLNPLLFTSIRSGGRVNGLDPLVKEPLHAQASCFRMLLSQPPQENVTIGFTIQKHDKVCLGFGKAPQPNKLEGLHLDLEEGFDREKFDKGEMDVYATFSGSATLGQAAEDYRTAVMELFESAYEPINRSWSIDHWTVDDEETDDEETDDEETDDEETDEGPEYGALS